MRGKLRFTVYMAVACGLAYLLTFGAPAFASAPPISQNFTGYAVIDGPVYLQISISPPVTSPGQSIAVDVTLTNRLAQSVSPTVNLTLPAALSSSTASLQRYPSGTTFDNQRNALSWQPVVAANEGVEQLSLQYEVSVADLSRPEQKVGVSLSYGASSADTSVTFWSGSPPTAAITVDPPVVAVGQPVKLQAHPGGPGPFTGTWNLGDGRQITTHDPEVAFAVPGIYEIHLQVANPLAVASAISAVTVVSQPTADFAPDDERPVIGQPVQFINKSGGERPLTSNWDFGDGAQSQEANPTHTFHTPGTYIVRLVTTSPFGQSEISIPVSVGVTPIADMALPDQTFTGEPVQAMAFGDDSITSLRWDMGDGRQYEGDTVTHTYHRTGDFVVRLTALNEYGETQVTRQIHVEGGRYALYLPVLIQPVGLDNPAPIEEQIAPAVTGTVETLPPTAESPPATIPVIPTQSGSTLPSPGGAAAGLPAVGSQPLALPPQIPLGDNVTTAEQLLWYVNEARRLHGLAPLSYNYELSIAAQQHTVDMALNAEIMHEGSDGSRPADRQRRYGYLGAYGGEAVAWGWESPVPVVEFWVNSPSHRTLILNPDADEIGVGHTADGTAPNIWYWAVEFGILAGVR